MQGGKGKKDVAEEGKALLSLRRWFFSDHLFLEFESIWPVDIH